MIARTVILGDVGAQVWVFRRALASLGIDPDTGEMPDGLKLIQVGDITRGLRPEPGIDSSGCALIADRLLSRNPGRYVQLLGNHDTAHLGGAQPGHWHIDDQASAILVEWRVRRACAYAAVVQDSAGRDVLVTHAGLTFGFWDAMGRPDSPRAVANALNMGIGHPEGPAGMERPGTLARGTIRTDACTSWAEINGELHPGWLAHREVPFGQIHGHGGPYHWDGEAWWPNTPLATISATALNVAEKRARTTVGVLPDGSPAVFESVDWMLGNAPRDDICPLLTLPGPGPSRTRAAA